jgi:hypothetical protein
MIDGQPILGLLVQWLQLNELNSVRALNPRTLTGVRKSVWSLQCERLADSKSLIFIADYFHQIKGLQLRNTMMMEAELERAFVSFKSWKLSELYLYKILHLNDKNLEILVQNMPNLLKLGVDKCFQIRNPCLIGPALQQLSLDHCLLSRFDSKTSLPVCESVSISSRVLDTFNAERLVQERLKSSPIRYLSLSACSIVERLRLTQTEVPYLVSLNLHSCVALEQIHIASTTLCSLDLSLCVALRHLVLHVARLKSLDLSLLQSLEGLLIECPSLLELKLDGCIQLTLQNTSLECPSLVTASCLGTTFNAESLLHRQHQIE